MAHQNPRETSMVLASSNGWSLHPDNTRILFENRFKIRKAAFRKNIRTKEITSRNIQKGLKSC